VRSALQRNQDPVTILCEPAADGCLQIA